MKNHSITVSVVSESDGVVNQEILLKEYAGSPEELTMKNFTITDYVLPAVDAAMKALASSGGFPTGIPSVPGKPK